MPHHSIAKIIHLSTNNKVNNYSITVIHMFANLVSFWEGRDFQFKPRVKEKKNLFNLYFKDSAKYQNSAKNLKDKEIFRLDVAEEILWNANIFE